MSKTQKKTVTIRCLLAFIVINIGNLLLLYIFNKVADLEITAASLFVSVCFANMYAYVMSLLIVGLSKESNKSK